MPGFVAGIALAALLGSTAGARPRDDVPRVGTLAYVVTRCSYDASGYFAEQELRVQQGYDAPKTIVRYRLKDIPEFQLIHLDMERLVLPAICQRFGQDRAGGGAELAAPLNRVLASPDGKHVVFHVSDDHLPLNEIFYPFVDVELPAATAEGFYVVDTDGTRLRWLGHKVTVPATVLDTRGSPHPSDWQRNGVGGTVTFSPGGRFVAYVDIDDAPGSAGDGHLQVMLLDIINGKRHQLTQLTTAPCAPEKGALEVLYPTFLGRHTVLFGRYVQHTPGEPCELAKQNYSIEQCTVRTDGSHLTCIPQPRVAGIPIEIDPTLRIVGRRRSILTLPVAPATDGDRLEIAEIFSMRGRDLLEITKLGSSSTRGRFLTPDGRRIFFTTAADPLGTNPGDRCELFSIGALGGGLRQITRFNYDPSIPPGSVPKGSGCRYTGTPGCEIGATYYDPGTKAVVFMSNCDLLGTGVSGEQAFTMWTDGSGLRQLTHAGGCEGLCVYDPGSPEFTRVELPGFLSYAPWRPHRRH